MAVQKDIEKRPYIYFNDDLSLMLVQDQHTFSADIFTRDAGSQKVGRTQSKMITWRLKYHIHRYPLILKGLCSANFLFSPSFSSYIDIDYENGRFVIRETATEKEIGHIP